MYVQNVITDRNLHQFLLLAEVLKTKSTLLLISHVCKLLICIVDELIFANCPIFDSIHDLEVYADDCLRFLVQGLVIVAELAIVGPTTHTSTYVVAPALRLSEEEADHFDQDYENEAEDGPWDEDHYNTMR